VPGIAPWISVNPVPGGVLPTDVGGLTSDDIDNGTPGLWYYYDPNETIDISGHGSDWITQDSNGVEFYGVFDLLKDAKYSYNYSQGGRVSTALMKPDGSGQFQFGDLAGFRIEFLIEAGETQPHAENQDIGVFVGLSDKTVMSTVNGRDTFGLGAWYESTSAGGAGVEAKSWNPHTHQNHTGSTLRKHWAGFNFWLQDDDEVDCGYHLFTSLDADGEHNNVRQAKLHGSEKMALTDKVYLTVGVHSYTNAGSGDGVKVTGAWKIWYRITWSPKGISPDYIAGGNNINSGFSSGYFD